jgi:hypothetical protein
MSYQKPMRERREWLSPHTQLSWQEPDTYPKPIPKPRPLTARQRFHRNVIREARRFKFVRGVILDAKRTARQQQRVALIKRENREMARCLWPSSKAYVTTYYAYQTAYQRGLRNRRADVVTDRNSVTTLHSALGTSSHVIPSTPSARRTPPAQGGAPGSPKPKPKPKPKPELSSPKGSKPRSKGNKPRTQKKQAYGRRKRPRYPKARVQAENRKRALKAQKSKEKKRTAPDRTPQGQNRMASTLTPKREQILSDKAMMRVLAEQVYVDTACKVTKPDQKKLDVHKVNLDIARHLMRSGYGDQVIQQVLSASPTFTRAHSKAHVKEAVAQTMQEARRTAHTYTIQHQHEQQFQLMTMMKAARSHGPGR